MGGGEGCQVVVFYCNQCKQVQLCLLFLGLGWFGDYVWQVDDGQFFGQWCYVFVIEYGVGVLFVDIFFLAGDDYGGYVIVQQVVQCMGDVDELVDGQYQYQVYDWNGWDGGQCGCQDYDG